MDRNYEMLNYVEHGKRAVEALTKDVIIWVNGIPGKTPGTIDFDAVQEYLELLKSEFKRVEQGIYAKDNSIYYTSGGKISFDKLTKTR